ncbi:MAG: methyltransferase domain-containing protein [Bacteroidia bacterium]
MNTTFSNTDIADYYDQTEIHYRRGWKLSENLALHYGYWDDKTSNLSEALQRMNERLAELGHITAEDYVLDSGCGVGGSSIFLARTIGCRTKGITLSAKQVESAGRYAKDRQVDHLCTFEQKDYTQTGYPAATFDVVWAIESSGTAPDKMAFINEAYRILKPGGRLVIADVYRGKEQMSELDNKRLLKVLNGWAMTDVDTPEVFKKKLEQGGFQQVRHLDISANIQRSATRIFWGGISMFFIAHIYKLFNPKVRHFAHNHYKALVWQYPTLQKKLWAYCMVYAEKK